MRRAPSSGDQPPPPAVVVGLDAGVTGLQTARILAGHGIPVVGISARRNHFSCRTRSCRRILVADTASDEFLSALRWLGPQLPQRGVLYPCTDLTVLSISRHREELERWYHVVLPEPDIVEMLLDKVRFYRYAQGAALPIPRTYFLERREDAESAAGSLSYPAIVKPPVKTKQWERHAPAKVFRVSGPQELLSVYEQGSRWTDMLIAQEWIEGPETSLFSCNGYFDASSKPIVTFVSRKIRQWPPETGISSLGVECRNDVVLQETIRLFSSVGFRGLAYLEMKRDSRTGRHLIVEPNIGRPTARSSIAEAGGVELLYSLYCDVVGNPLPSSLEQRHSGVKWIHLKKDLRSAIYRWRRGELSPLQWWHSVRGRKVEAVFSWSDPVPFLVDMSQSLRSSVRRSPQDREGDVPSHSTKLS